MTPQEDLVRACESNHINKVASLLESGAASAQAACTTRSSRFYNWLPLHTALYNKRYEVVDYLLSWPGVDVNEPTLNPQQTTPLHIAAWHCPALVGKLLDAGARVNAKDGYGQTALHDAAFHGHTQAVKVLLSRGADKSIRNCRGLTALDRARKQQHTAIVALLS